jgi:hypothetical protein
VPEKSPGRVMTFYSFKGGTGRSMALANVATLIAQRNGGNNVLAIDWDLEAPGLHRYFRPYVQVSDLDNRDRELDDRPGLIEFLTEARDQLSGLERILTREEISHVFSALGAGKYLLHTDIPKLKLLKAGAFNSSYSARINTFDWEGLYKSQPFFFGGFSDYLGSNWDFALVDSRTGFTDISGICTSLLPDAIVAVFTPNLQSLAGVLDVVKQAAAYRSQSDDLRPLTVFPLVSRVELSELKLNEVWRFGDSAEGVEGYQPQFESLFKEVYGLPSCDLKAYFDEAQIQYIPFYSFGEKIAARSREATPFSLARSYEAFADIVHSAAPAWELKARERPILNTEWIEDNKRRALAGIEKVGQRATMEVRFSLARVKLKSSRTNLLDAAKAAENHGIDWGIGAVLNDEESRPKPATDGIYAEIFRPGRYTYWALRGDGDFFSLRSLPNIEYSSSQNVRIVTLDAGTLIRYVAETLLYCKRLYEKLGVAPVDEVQIIVEHSGLEGRRLVRGGIVPLKGPSEIDPLPAGLEVGVGRIEIDLLELVKKIAEPIFEVFDFVTFPDSVYVDEIEGLLLQLRE